jgi:hypothetical protein
LLGETKSIPEPDSRVVFRQTYFTQVEQLERALPRYFRFYNEERTYRGYRLQGRTPRSVFRERTA